MLHQQSNPLGFDDHHEPPWVMPPMQYKMSDTFSSVPAIDYARLATPETKAEELNKLREAIFVVGFLYLTNTGLEVRVRQSWSLQKAQSFTRT